MYSGHSALFGVELMKGFIQKSGFFLFKLASYQTSCLGSVLFVCTCLMSQDVWGICWVEEWEIVSPLKFSNTRLFVLHLLNIFFVFSYHLSNVMSSQPQVEETA